LIANTMSQPLHQCLKSQLIGQWAYVSGEYPPGVDWHLYSRSIFRESLVQVPMRDQLIDTVIKDIQRLLPVPPPITTSRYVSRSRARLKRHRTWRGIDIDPRHRL
jgi:hypothetical protein